MSSWLRGLQRTGTCYAASPVTDRLIVPHNQVSEDRARTLVETFFRKEVSSVSKLDSYDDNNFRVVVAGSGETFTLKVSKTEKKKNVFGEMLDFARLRCLFFG